MAGGASALPAIGANPGAVKNLQEKLSQAAVENGLSVPPPGEAEGAPKLAEVVKKAKVKSSSGDPRPVRGVLKMSSGTKDQKYVYIPDALVQSDKRDKLTAAKLLQFIDLPMPQLIFYVTSGDVAQTWEFRQPNHFDLESGSDGKKKGAGGDDKKKGGGDEVSKGAGDDKSKVDDEEARDAKLLHWRTVIRNKLMRVLTNTAKSCKESGAYFCVDASGYDAIGWYLQNACTRDNRILAVAHGVTGEQDAGAGAFGWCEEVMKEFKTTEGVEEADKELGCNLIIRKPDDTVELSDDWLDGDRLAMTSAEIEERCEAMGVDAQLGGRDAYKYHPSSAPTHLIVCESIVGRRIVEGILNKSVASGEFVINGSFPGAARRVGAALNDSRPLFVLQHTGGCADLASVMLDQVKAVEKLHIKQEAEARRQGKDKDKGRKSLEDRMAEHLPFDPFQARNADWVIDKPPKIGMPRIQFTGIVGNKTAKTQPEMISLMNATFVNFPPNANPDARLVIDPFVLRGAELQDLISRTMCSAGDVNDELNGEFADQKRLHLAWEMHGALTNAAARQAQIASSLMLLILQLSFITASISILRSNAEWFFPYLSEATTTSVPLPTLDPTAAANMAARSLSEVGSGGSAGAVEEGETSITTPVDGSCAADPTSLICQLTEYMAIVVPALVTTLLTIQSYLDPDSQVITLKSGAARIESEIYMFRTRTGAYSRVAAVGGGDEEDGGGSGPVAPRQKFGDKITAIWDGMLKSSVSEHSMPRRFASHDHRAKLRKEYEATQHLVAKYMPSEFGGGADDDDEKEKEMALDKGGKGAKGKGVKKNKVAPTSGEKNKDSEDEGGESALPTEDSGFGPMSAEEYVRFRMLPKLIAMSKLSPIQARRKSRYKMLAITLSAATTLLGALDRPVPVPLIVQLASALAGWEAYKQMTIALKLTNSAVGQLERLVLWWQSLSMIEKRRPDCKERLVRTTEEVISSAVPELAIARQMEANDEEAEGDKKG